MAPRGPQVREQPRGGLLEDRDISGRGLLLGDVDHLLPGAARHPHPDRARDQTGQFAWFDQPPAPQVLLPAGGRDTARVDVTQAARHTVESGELLAALPGRPLVDDAHQHRPRTRRAHRHDRGPHRHAVEDEHLRHGRLPGQRRRPGDTQIGGRHPRPVRDGDQRAAVDADEGGQQADVTDRRRRQLLQHPAVVGRLVGREGEAGDQRAHPPWVGRSRGVLRDPFDKPGAVGQPLPFAFAQTRLPDRQRQRPKRDHHRQPDEQRDGSS